MRIAITIGEPAGIGPDICLALRPRSDCQQILIGSPEVLRDRARRLGRPCPSLLSESPEALIAILPVEYAAPVSTGVLDPDNAQGVLATLDRAIAGCASGEFSAMVTAPVHKGVINDAGIHFSGHTEYLATACDADPVMLLATHDLRVALVTTHLPLRAVPDAITATAITRTLGILRDALRDYYAIEQPRILVLGLNPHAGEAGYLGTEEIDTIAPALEALREEGFLLDGPVPADTAFTAHQLQSVDAVLAMYHDQGLPVLKYADFGRAVNITLGLPIIRTSVDHGTALELAGSGRAQHQSLEAAVDEAVRFSINWKP